jgi:alanyl-tRNA synthetase
MKQLSSAEIRQGFLQFFQQRGHVIVPSSSLIPGNDPTLLFTNAGMVQFKETFLGLEQRPYARATSAQKCMRVSGKHNDLDEVGPSPRHHTFFEMLGNFSFGEYFKRDAIAFAYELLTRVYGIPLERLIFTVHQDDQDSPRFWIEDQQVPPERVLRMGDKTNFWSMGDTGPCGPTSEAHYDWGPEACTCHAPDCSVALDNGCDRWLEVWNLVFMQYNQDADGTRTPLPRPGVDTGMGQERIVSVLQGARSNYETDLFRPIIERTIALAATDEAHYRAHVAPYRAVADHTRACTFLIADGILPGNEGRSYVLRRILRRAAYQGRTIGLTRPFLAQTADVVIEMMGDTDIYPELRNRRAFILETLTAEEERFGRTISSGLVKLDALVQRMGGRGATELAGDEAFRLKDTDGFPLDLTQRILAERGLTVDEAGYAAALEEQRQRSRAATQFKRGAEAEIWAEQDLPATEFTGYANVADQGRVLALVVAGDAVSEAREGQRVQLVLDRTPFYAESGGQVGDTGLIASAGGQVRIDDTQRPLPGLIVHYGEVERGALRLGDAVAARVHAERRHEIMRNHTATHLLHRALRDVLGEHAAQAGSLVAPDRLRFDFTHPRPMTPEQLREVERRINAWVRADTAVEWEVTGYQDALARGAMALFGEKYGDRVRMVTVGCDDERPTTNDQRPTTNDELSNTQRATRDLQQTTDHGLRTNVMCSRELCGGTHVARTGEIGFFRIIGEGGIASGVRRIEALTGAGAEAWVEAQAATARELAARLGVPPAQVLERVEALQAELKQRQQELAALRSQSARGALEGLLGRAQQQDGVTYVAARVEATDAAQLREMGDWLRDKLGSAVIVLGTLLNDKPQILVVVTPDLVERGYHAGNLVKALAQVVGGGGGGRPDMAQAGGRDAGKLDAALSGVPALLAQQGMKR